MIRKFLKGFLKSWAIKHLGLIEKPGEKSLAHLAIVENKELKRALEVAVYKHQNALALVDKMRSKYPEVWMQGNVAQGVLQIPKLKMACEFFREDNRLCIFVPWNKATGKKPRDFVPEWLEIDDELQIEGGQDSQNGTGILYKIPIKGWDDTITLSRKLEDDHPSYGLDGKPIEKTRSFRSVSGINGTFRREKESDGIFCNVYFFEPEFGPLRTLKN